LATFPIDPVLPSLLAALRKRASVVLRAAPGAGKTTRVPEVLLESGLVQGRILVLEPRRVAARSAARFLAQRRSERLGDTIGLEVRFERAVSKQTRVVFMTEGVLTRRFLSDPFLDGVGAVVLDEFHERSLQTDLAIALLKELLTVRDDLKVVVMSATIDTNEVARFLDDAPVIESEGRAFPLTITHLDKPDDRYLDEKVASHVRRALTEVDDDGDALVFLPGAPEIHRVRQRLTERALPGDAEVLTLYGSMSSETQDRVFSRGDRRRVILATNIAETSVTIEGVTIVVDSGLEKRVRYDAATHLSRLVTSKISLESATQRAGRAGRTRPGHAFRLWTRAEHALLAKSTPPEIATTDLSALALDVLAFRSGDVRTFSFLTPPPDAHLTRALAELRFLSAVDESAHALTTRGQKMATLPCPPREGALLLAASETGALDDAALTAALLEERDVLLDEPRGDTSGSDLEARLARLDDVRGHGGDPRKIGARAFRACGLDEAVAVRVLMASDSLRSLVDDKVGRDAPGGREERLLRALLSAWPDRLVQRRVDAPGEGVLTTGQGVVVDKRSLAKSGRFFIALSLELSAKDGAPLVRMATPVSEELVLDVLGAHIRTVETARFEPSTERVKGVRRRMLFSLLLDEKEGVDVGSEAVKDALFAAALDEPARALVFDDDSTALLTRLRAARVLVPDETWPDVEPRALVEMLRAHVDRPRAFQDLARADWSRVLRAEIPYQTWSRLDALLPARITVPSGRALAVDYTPVVENGGPPVLAVKLQEMFGATRTPSVVNGRVPLLLHLLSPGGRPVQVTQDLVSFWDRTYVEVRKELRQRYPRHPWPDDPRSAPPTARAKPRGT
jgi:ATP-dependent helicase HrpB